MSQRPAIPCDEQLKVETALRAYQKSQNQKKVICTTPEAKSTKPRPPLTCNVGFMGSQ